MKKDEFHLDFIFFLCFLEVGETAARDGDTLMFSHIYDIVTIIMTEIAPKETERPDVLSDIRAILDEYGVVSSTERVVRDAGFAFSGLPAILGVQERVSLADPSGAPEYRVFGGDDVRSEWVVSDTQPLDFREEHALRGQLETYVDSRKAENFVRSFGSAAAKASLLE